MRRSLASRVTAMLMALWFVAVSAGPELTHACPTHGAHAMASSSVASHAASMGTPQASAGDHHSASHTSPTPERTNHCTCLGQCCSASPVALVTDAIALADTATAATRDAGLPAYAYVPVAAQHVLPLAQAPPPSA